MSEHKCLEIDVLPVTDEYMQHNYVKSLLYEFIEDIIMFCTIYPFLNILNCAVCKDKVLSYIGLSLLPVIMIMTFMRVKIRKRFVYDMAVLVTAAAYFGLTLVIPYKNIFGFAAIVCAAVGIWKSKKKQNVRYNMNSLIEHEILLIVMLFIAITMKNQFIQIMILVCGLIIMVVSCAYLSKARNVRLIKDDPKNETFRHRDSTMFAVQMAVLISVLLIILQVTGVFAAANRWSNRIVNNIQQAAMGTYQVQPQQEIKKDKVEQKPIDMSKVVNAKPNKFLSALMVAISVVVTIIAAIIAISIIYMVLNRIMIDIKRFANSDKVTFVFKENGETEKKEKEKHENVITKNIFLSPRDKIRKIYRKKVKSYKKSGVIVRQNRTVSDIEKEVLDKAGSNIDYISNMYEKARYSNEEISKDDIVDLKNK